MSEVLLIADHWWVWYLFALNQKWGNTSGLFSLDFVHHLLVWANVAVKVLLRESSRIELVLFTFVDFNTEVGVFGHDIVRHSLSLTLWSYFSGVTRHSEELVMLVFLSFSLLSWVNRDSASGGEARHCALSEEVVILVFESESSELSLKVELLLCIHKLVVVVAKHFLIYCCKVVYLLFLIIISWCNSLKR